MKKALQVTVVILFALHLVLWFWLGIATPVTTVLLYTGIWWCGKWVLNFLRPAANANTNMQLAWGTLITGFLIAEVVLRIVPGTQLTFKEKFNPLYISEYKTGRLQTLAQKYGAAKQDTAWYFTAAPNKTRVLERDGFSYTHRYNQLGMRSPQIPANSSKPLVLVLGDSFTEGNGAPQDSTWVQLFENAWNATGNTPITALNAGKAGSDPYFELMLLQKLLRTHQPAVVIMAINTTDIDDIILRGGNERFMPNGHINYRTGPAWEGIYATSIIARTLIQRIAHTDWTLLTPAQKATALTQALNSINTCILRFKQLGTEKGFVPVVVFNPLEEDIQKGNWPLEEVARKAEQDTLPVSINLLNAFLNGKLITPQNSKTYYWPNDLHHNSAGYRLWALTLADTLSTNERIVSTLSQKP